MRGGVGMEEDGDSEGRWRGEEEDVDMREGEEETRKGWKDDIPGNSGILLDTNRKTNLAVIEQGRTATTN